MTAKKKIALAMIVDGGTALIKSLPILIATRRLNKAALIGLLEIIDGARIMLEKK